MPTTSGAFSKPALICGPGPVSRAHSCKPKRKPKGNTRDGSQRRERGRPKGSARSISPVAWGSVEQAYIASWQPEIPRCRKVTLQLAEVAVTQMLQDILQIRPGDRCREA